MRGLAIGVTVKPSPSFSTTDRHGCRNGLVRRRRVGGGTGWTGRSTLVSYSTFVGLALGVIAAVVVVYSDVKTFL